MDWSELEEKIKANLSRASADAKHPWRYPVLATVNEGQPEQRTLVLRKFIPSTWSLLFYTDSRSPKVSEIKENKQVSLLFYHTRRQWQLRLKGRMSIDTESARTRALFEQLPKSSLGDYKSRQPPGHGLEPGQKQGLTESDYFCLLEFELIALDYLELDRNGHRRLAATNGTGGLIWQEIQA